MPLDKTVNTDTRDNAVHLLEAAAARLRDVGWIRGTTGPPEGPNCVIGALSMIANQWAMGDAYITAGRALSEFVGEPTYWNDNFCPDAPTAVDTLLQTAKFLAGQS